MITNKNKNLEIMKFTEGQVIKITEVTNGRFTHEFKAPQEVKVRKINKSSLGVIQKDKDGSITILGNVLLKNVLK